MREPPQARSGDRFGRIASALAALLLGIATLACTACAGPYKVASADPLPFPAASELAGKRNVAVIYVHGIGCHEPGYSAPFQYRMAERLGLKRSAGQRRDGVPVTDFYEFQDIDEETEGSLSRSLYIQKRWFVREPDFAAWLKGDAGAAKKRVQAGLRKASKTEPESTVALQAFRTFSDVCLDRDLKNKELPTSPMHNAGVGVRVFEGPDATYTFYEVLWSPISETWKVENLGYDFRTSVPELGRTDALTRHQDRAYANGMIKDLVLNGTIPDAVFYIGQGNASIKQVILAALCFAQENGEPPAVGADPDRSPQPGCEHDGPAPTSYPHTIFVSESLGSRALLDTLAELPATIAFLDGLQRTSRSALVDNVLKGRFFMFANQLPMIEIGQPSYSRPVFDTLEPEDWVMIDNHEPLSGGTPVGRCVVDSGRSASPLFETDGYTPVLRAWRDGRPKPAPALLSDGEAAPDIDLWRDAAQRKSAIAGYMGELADCREAVWSPQAGGNDSDFQLAFYKHQRLTRSLGPRGLDLILQERAINEIEKAAAERVPMNVLKARLAAQAFRVYAFSDANDLLTWEVTPRFKNFFAMVDFVNVQQRIAKPILPFDGAAGGVVDPLQAHMNYRYSDDTMDVVMCALGERTRSHRDCTKIQGPKKPGPDADGRT